MKTLSNLEKGKQYIKRVEEIRQTEHLTQMQVCKALGLTYSALYFCPATKKQYRFKTLRALKEFITMYETEYPLWKVRMKLFTQ